jgi:glycosyltransferase involved in cell wall biosynthesis
MLRLPAIPTGDVLNSEVDRLPAALGSTDPIPLPVDVLAINRVSFIGGVERVLLTAAQAVADRDWSTALACPAGELGAEAQNRGVAFYPTELGPVSRSDIHWTPAAGWRLACSVQRAASSIVEAARRTRCKILHVHHPAIAVEARKASRRLETPIIWHVHETAPMAAAYHAVGMLAAHSCDLMICVSKASRDMVRALGAPEERIRVVYNAAEPHFFAPVDPVREPWPEGPHIGLFGVMEPRKGHADLIRALALVSSSHPTLQLWLVGGDTFERHADYRIALERLSQGLGVADRVHFTGMRKDVPQLMARMDVVISASVCSESLPTVLIEACALGRPVIGTRVGGAEEIIRHLRNGLLVPPAAPRELANAIDLALSPAGAAFGRRARVDALARFSPERFAVDLDGCYRALTAPRLAGRA